MIRDTQHIARSAALLFSVGGMFAVVALFLPHPPGSNEVGVAAVGLVALATAAVLWVGGAAFPRWVFAALMLGGTGLISFAMYCWRPGPVASAVALLYVWVLLYAWYWFTTRVALLETVVAGASFAVVLALQRGNSAAATQWMVTIGTATVAGVLIGWLVHQVEALADTDPLTRLPNRRAWERALDRELARAARHGTPLTVAVADLDGFKGVNDTLGHQAGDDLLRRLAAAWGQNIRKGELVARYGGDEFAFVLACTRDAASEVIGRVLQSFPEQSCTAGIATWDGRESREDLVRRADVALYGKKRGSTRSPARTADIGTSGPVTEQERTSAGSVGEPDPARHTVLVIDDDERFRRMMRMLLSDDPTIEVVEAADGADGVATARRCRPQVVLLDLAMPTSGGLEAIPLIVAVSPHSRIVVLSAMDAHDVAQRSVDLGALAFLQKDGDLSVLLDYLRPLLV